MSLPAREFCFGPRKGIWDVCLLLGNADAGGGALWGAYKPCAISCMRTAELGSRYAVRLCWVVFCFFLPNDAFANNGFNSLAFSVEGAGMAGADVPVARDALSLSVNPAGLSQLERRQVDSLVSLVVNDSSHSDQFTDGSRKNANRYIIVPNSWVAQPLLDGTLTLGAGIFAQGGSGPVYNNIDTAFGTRDELSSVFRLVKASVGLSYKVSQNLSVGVAPTVVYGDLEQRVFPETSVADAGDPSNSFFGSKLNGAKGFAPGVRFGALYRPTERVSIGLAYATESSLELNDANFVANYEALGLGRVKYRDAKVKGLALPREASLGVAFQATKELLVSIEGTWIDWSSAIRKIRTEAKDPNDPAAPSKVVIQNEQNWRDQYVLAVGLAYQPKPEWIVRGGYNYGRNPIPNRNLSPLLANITEHHFTVGAGYHPGDNWMFDIALEYDLPAEVNYNNQATPFTQNAKERLAPMAVWLSTSYRW